MTKILGEKPAHDTFAEPLQWRAKVQRFSKLPPELVVRQVDFERENDRYLSAYRRGVPFTGPGATINVPAPVRRPRDPDAPRNPESVHRSAVRAKKKLKDLVKELAPEGLLTLTSRERLVDLDSLYRVYGRFLRVLRETNPEFAGVAVPEKHVSGKHLHMHVAYRGLTLGFNALRRLWHIALEADQGRRVTRMLRGAEAPGNIDVQARGSRGDVATRAKRIARYMGKYLSKDMVREFGRKAYSPTRNITLENAVRFYLSALTPEAARREALGLLGVPEAAHDVVRFWMPSDSFAFAELPEGLAAPPPPI
jgi:hypothetical protein